MNSTKPTSSNQTYSKTVSSPHFPSRDQAIVIHAATDIKLEEYVNEVSRLTGPNNIQFASRISNNRVCIYLSSTKTADQFVFTHNSLNINGQNVKVRKLLNSSKRIVLSGVSPHIPHNIIEQHLTEMGLKLASSVNFMRAGLKKMSLNTY